MQAEFLNLKDIVTDPANVRMHSDRNIEAIKGSLQRFGQQKPIVVDSKNVVVAGSGTLEAAASLGWERIAVVRSKLEGTDRMAYAIADNRTAELAGWDDDALNKALASLKEQEGIDELVTGFDANEVALRLADGSTPPSSFREFDEENVDADHECPKCGYKWSESKGIE